MILLFVGEVTREHTVVLVIIDNENIKMKLMEWS